MPISEHQKQKVLEKLNESSYRQWSVSGVAEAIGYGRETTRRCLEELYSEGKVLRNSGGRYTHYQGKPVLGIASVRLDPLAKPLPEPNPGLLTTISISIFDMDDATPEGLSHYSEARNVRIYRSDLDQFTVRLKCGEEFKLVASKFMAGLAALAAMPVAKGDMDAFLEQSDD